MYTTPWGQTHEIYYQEKAFPISLFLHLHAVSMHYTSEDRLYISWQPVPPPLSKDALRDLVYCTPYSRAVMFP